jgi:hypothetical protein
MVHCWCGARSSKPLWDRQALARVGSIPTHPRITNGVLSHFSHFLRPLRIRCSAVERDAMRRRCSPGQHFSLSHFVIRVADNL